MINNVVSCFSKYGIPQGIQVQPGIDDKIHWQNFFAGLTNWCNCKHKDWEMGDPMLHVCKNVNA